MALFNNFSFMPIQYLFPIKLSVNGQVASTEILSTGFDALVCVFFMTTRDFAFDLALW